MDVIIPRFISSTCWGHVHTGIPTSVVAVRPSLAGLASSLPKRLRTQDKRFRSEFFRASVPLAQLLSTVVMLDILEGGMEPIIATLRSSSSCHQIHIWVAVRSTSAYDLS
jgi:hypothetical protein